LAINVGGTGLKASVLSPDGDMLVDQVRIETGYPCPPEGMIAALRQLASTLPPYDRVSVGFDSPARDGAGGSSGPSRPSTGSSFSTTSSSAAATPAG
jgi:predicted NBD/HSP70 family sugar kinase